MSAIKVNASNFDQEVIKSNLPVLVDFWAEWCNPCKAIGPIVDEISQEYESKLKVVKVNVDEAQEIAARYNIMSIPTLIVFKNGEAMEERIVGALSKDQMIDKIEPILSAGA